jgi:hypothetical protein
MTNLVSRHRMDGDVGYLLIDSLVDPCHGILRSPVELVLHVNRTSYPQDRNHI